MENFRDSKVLTKCISVGNLQGREFYVDLLPLMIGKNSPNKRKKNIKKTEFLAQWGGLEQSGSVEKELKVCVGFFILLEQSNFVLNFFFYKNGSTAKIDNQYGLGQLWLPQPSSEKLWKNNPDSESRWENFFWPQKRFV